MADEEIAVHSSTESNTQAISAEVKSSDESSRPMIFLSYRVQPDQPIAAALKRLIEDSLEPAPEVFVSGLGGLLPSEVGYKQQLQYAIQKAKIIIGVITENSKDREWIFYEAGAAWGRGIVYAPVLFDVAASHMPGSISDYQATRHSSKEECKRLLETVAARCSLQFKNYFTKRYETFLRSVASARNEETDELQKTELDSAIELLLEGKKAEGVRLLKQLLDKTDAAEEKANIIVSRLVFSGLDSRFERFKLLYELDSSIKETAAISYWLSIYEPNSFNAIQYAEKALSLSANGTMYNRYAIERLFELYCSLGYKEKAQSYALRALTSEDRELQADVSLRCLREWPELSPVGKLVLLCVGLSSWPTDVLRSVGVDLCIEQDWIVLALSLVASGDPFSTGRSANNLGICYEKNQLLSLAFSAFEKASELGVSVAKVNMARLLLVSRIPIAGLNILKPFEGSWDSADPAYPYQVRAQIEGELDQQRKQADLLIKQGGQVFAKISEFLAKMLVSKKKP